MNRAVSNALAVGVGVVLNFWRLCSWPVAVARRHREKL